MKSILRNWWPVPAMLAPIISIQVVWSSRYDPSGHAADHFSSATAIFGLTFLVAVLVWALPGNVRRRAELWLFSAAVLTAALVATIGNLRIVDAIGADDWSIDEANALGPLRPDYTSGHELAERAAYAVVAAVVVLAAWLWWRRAIHPGVAIGAIGLSIIFPSWIFPGAGIVVLAIAASVTRARLLQRPRSAPLEPAKPN
jgi:hypothetical protein